MNLLERIRRRIGLWRLKRSVIRITAAFHGVGVSAEKATEALQHFAESRRGYIR